MLGTKRLKDRGLCGEMVGGFRKPSRIWKVKREQKQTQALITTFPASTGPETIEGPDFTLANDVTSSLQDRPSLRLVHHTHCHFLLFIVSWMDACHITSPAITPLDTTGYLCLHCTWNSSTKLQKETPGTTDTLKWKSSEPCGKNTPGISNIDMYVPLSKNIHWGYFPYWCCIEKFPSLF